MVAKHFGHDPYELWHKGREDLPPHPHPAVYRSLLYAMAWWIEKRETERMELLPVLWMAKLGFGKSSKSDKKAAKQAVKRARRKD